MGETYLNRFFYPVFEDKDAESDIEITNVNNFGVNIPDLFVTNVLIPKFKMFTRWRRISRRITGEEGIMVSLMPDRW